MAVDVLYEIGVEEIPAGAVLPALEQLETGLRAGLTELRLAFGEIRTYGTPRRLAILIEAVQEQQEEAVLEIKGPPAAQGLNAEGQPTPAAQGFARSRGLRPEDLQVRSTDKGDFLFAFVTEPGRRLAEVLPELLEKLTLGLTFPKTMRWGDQELRFARPLRWLVALAGEEVLDLQIGAIKADRYSSGHRVLGHKQVLIPAPAAYLETLRAEGVVADHRERRAAIVAGAQARAAECGGEALLDEKIVTEVNFLVEHPLCVRGSFNPDYLRLPREVIITVMQGHQKYFPVGDGQGNLLPHFLVVTNSGPAAEAAVLAGNEKVLVPRLEDAQFYLEEDMKRPLSDRGADLEQVAFLGGMGTLRDKTARLVSLVHWLDPRLGLEVAAHEAAERAAQLCKCDLVTMMIGDSKLGELQGIVGGHYARLSGEPEAVAVAVGEHYLPIGADDALPGSAAGALVSVADKTDNLAAAFRLGMEPTGSADPQALRRQATGLIRLVRDRGWSLPVAELFAEAFSLLPEPPATTKAPLAPAEAGARLEAFLAQRLEALWEAEAIAYDVARATLGVPWTDLVEVSARACYLAELRREQPERFEQLVTVAERPARIRRPAETPLDAPVDERLFAEPQESDLWARTQQAAAAVQAANAQTPPDYVAATEALLALAAPLHEFFAEVMIMAEDESLRRNRLALMARLDGLFLSLADFLKVVRPG
ncbi:MAG TPA: glycine--tRNA ligase subunit beta [Armatimonadota bacterium]|jgi:glycyl-tRNA synthetase beta chain